MAADLTLLVPAFRPRLETLLANCRARGVEMRPYTGLRTPLEQAKLWRQSRSREQIDAKVAQLRAAGADYLADCIVHVGPRNGDPVTNAVPVLSWHQWGEAEASNSVRPAAGPGEAHRRKRRFISSLISLRLIRPSGLGSGRSWTWGQSGNFLHSPPGSRPSFFASSAITR